MVPDARHAEVGTSISALSHYCSKLFCTCYFSVVHLCTVSRLSRIVTPLMLLACVTTGDDSPCARTHARTHVTEKHTASLMS